MQNDALLQQAQSAIDQGSKSFAAAARLYKPAMRRDVMLLYAWCRHCDDVTDGQEFGRGRLNAATAETIQQLKADSIAACQGRSPDRFPYLALADVCKRHPLPESVIRDHIQGFERDVAGWRPQTEDDLLEYCYFVAGAVGILMALIMGVRDRATLLRACDLGVAFQLTNIARDVVEDARADRCYLPEDWLTQASLDIAELADPVYVDRVYPLVCRLVQMAEPYYQSANIGIRALPGRAAWAIATARSVYRDIGLKLLKSGPASIQQRSYTSQSRKVWRITTGAAQIIGGRLRRTNQDRPATLWTPRSIR